MGYCWVVFGLVDDSIPGGSSSVFSMFLFTFIDGKDTPCCERKGAGVDV